ncbi:hypothetical protein [Roseicella sp. DB1501]|uniref:hypothetical protein n=1 Tax=Roseicella sp. DB1501 TaxID=2730925 RepID=UPI001490B08B|nr:hypothetical protein [Roseicella sp. DB1501]NOG70494.1 hypothetical protein [Roseicella sp. DB1501]
MRKIDRFAAKPDYRKTPKTDYYCINCQRDIDPSKPHRMVHAIAGGDWYLHPEDEDQYVPDGGDCGFLPFGNDCAKRLGIEWTHEGQKP